MLGIMSYFNQLAEVGPAPHAGPLLRLPPLHARRRRQLAAIRLLLIHPERLKPIVATIGIEHMGGRQTIETGPGGNQYAYSTELPENGGVITSLMDVYNNNIWLVEAIASAATDNHWPRVDVKAGNVAPGVNGGFQGTVKSPMNKGRA